MSRSASKLKPTARCHLRGRVMGALMFGLLLGAMGVSTASAAEPAVTAALSTGEAQNMGPMQLRWSKSYAMGVDNYHLDHATKVTGWQVGERWYFGRQKGEDSGLTLVWQKQASQVSLSKDGVRFTRRF